MDINKSLFSRRKLHVFICIYLSIFLRFLQVRVSSTLNSAYPLFHTIPPPSHSAFSPSHPVPLVSCSMPSLSYLILISYYNVLRSLVPPSDLISHIFFSNSFLSKTNSFSSFLKPPQPHLYLLARQVPYSLCFPP